MRVSRNGEDCIVLFDGTRIDDLSVLDAITDNFPWSAIALVLEDRAQRTTICVTATKRSDRFIVGRTEAYVEVRISSSKFEATQHMVCNVYSLIAALKKVVALVAD